MKKLFFIGLLVLFCSCSTAIRFDPVNKQTYPVTRGRAMVRNESPAKLNTDFGTNQNELEDFTDLLHEAFTYIGQLTLETKGLGNVAEKLSAAGAEHGGDLVVIKDVLRSDKEVDKKIIQEHYVYTSDNVKKKVGEWVFDERENVTDFQVHAAVYKQKISRDEARKLVAVNTERSELGKTILNSSEKDVIQTLKKSALYQKEKVKKSCYLDQALKRGNAGIINFILEDYENLGRGQADKFIRNAIADKKNSPWTLREFVGFLAKYNKKHHKNIEFTQSKALLHAAMYSAEDTLWLLQNGATADVLVNPGGTDFNSVFLKGLVNRTYCNYKENFTTPLHVAVHYKNKKAEQYLLKYGADKKRTDSHCMTAYGVVSF